jgi:Protein phosphatase 2C
VNIGPPYVIGDPGRAAAELLDGPPPDRNGPADIEVSAAGLPGMILRAASSRGLAHRASAGVRQDAFAIRGWQAAGVVAVVCDGVGSLPLSDVAAAFVSRRLADLGAAGVPWGEAFQQVNAELRQVAANAAVDSGPAAAGMATTAVSMSVGREGDDWVGEVGWIGDSTVWHLDADGQWSCLDCPPDADDTYHATTVTPLPTGDGVPTIRSFRLRGGALFMMSDGVGNPLRWSREVRQTLAGWWTVPPDPLAFAAQVAFARKSHQDDRTVIGIWADQSGV